MHVQRSVSVSGITVEKISVETLLHRGGLWSLHSFFEALLDEVKLIAQRLIAIRHTDLGHVGLADVVALWTLLKVVDTQEVLLLLANGSIWVESDARWREMQSVCFHHSSIHPSIHSAICYLLAVPRQTAHSAARCSWRSHTCRRCSV